MECSAADTTATLPRPWLQMEDERKAVIKGTVSFQTEAGGELTQRTVTEAMKQTGMKLPPDLVLDPGAAELERVVAMFADRYENFATARAVKARDLPFRFKHADKWKHEAKTQHVVFTTTNHEYGFKPPRQEELATKVRITCLAPLRRRTSWPACSHTF